jgi:diguanylate cyclase (GGDEF)-like protein
MVKASQLIGSSSSPWAPVRRRSVFGIVVGFGTRLLVALALTLTAVGSVGFVLLAHQLRSNQIASYASEHRTDVRNIERIGQRDSTTLHALPAIDDLLAGVGERPGTVQTRLIDARSVVIAAGDDITENGKHESNARITRALRSGVSYAGLKGGPTPDRRDFEFIAPAHLPDGRYVLQVSYDHRVLDADFREIRKTVIWIGLLALIAGAAVFYLVGGRTLLHSHRIALQRATRDGLTDLPNHGAFQDEFPRAVSSAVRHQQALALIVLDIDDFKFLNDRHGHLQGDAILRRMADALRSGRVEDRAYRVGGDEFALLLPGTDGEGARAVATRLARALSGSEVVASMGISDLRQGQLAEDLHAEADAALYDAKRRGGHRIAHFDEIRDQTIITTSARTDLVRSLIDEGRMSMVFQPIWDLESTRLLGLEALMRPDPDSGLGNPAEAFDLAEQIGRVHDLDVLCAERALQEAPELPDGTLLFLNISPQTLDLDATSDGWLLDAAARAGISPDRVVLEVTERFGARTESVVSSLRRLRAEGFRIALDDVGTGNSGLEMLQKVNADFVKIDRSIVVAAPVDRSARAVLMAMATYARQTGSYVIAEGIEDQQTLDFLASIDDRDVHLEQIIQGGQGFGLGRPAPDGAVNRIPDLLARSAIARPA